MYEFVADHDRTSPRDTLHVLSRVAWALSAVFGSEDGSLLEDDATRMGFYHVGSALARSLEDLSRETGEHLNTVTSIVLERDRAREEAIDLRNELSIWKHIAERRGKEGAAPDLSEPAPPVASGDAALAG